MSNRSEDQVVRSGRREAVWVLLLWCAAALYTLGYCACFGYGRSADELRFVLGFPDWVFWGIVAPWTVCVVIGCWFAYFYMTDDDLGEQESDVGTDACSAAGDAAPREGPDA
jgi:hypothetical protein